MTVLEGKLIEAGQDLARAMGHHQTCPKHHPSIPCQCDAKALQPLALGQWEHLLDQIKNS